MSTNVVSATAAVRGFSEVLRRTADGREELLISRHRKVVARLTPAAPSPRTWYRFIRLVKRQGLHDTQLAADLAAARGRPDMAPGWPGTERTLSEGTVVLDATLLVDLIHRERCLHPLQRVVTTAAALAEIRSLPCQAPTLKTSRAWYVDRLARSIPILSMTQAAATLVEGASYEMPWVGLAEATARSVAFPLVFFQPD